MPIKLKDGLTIVDSLAEIPRIRVPSKPLVSAVVHPYHVTDAFRDVSVFAAAPNHLVSPPDMNAYVLSGQGDPVKRLNPKLGRVEATLSRGISHPLTKAMLLNIDRFFAVHTSPAIARAIKPIYVVMGYHENRLLPISSLLGTTGQLQMRSKAIKDSDSFLKSAPFSPTGTSSLDPNLVIQLKRQLAYLYLKYADIYKAWTFDGEKWRAKKPFPPGSIGDHLARILTDDPYSHSLVRGLQLLFTGYWIHGTKGMRGTFNPHDQYAPRFDADQALLDVVTNKLST